MHILEAMSLCPKRRPWSSTILKIISIFLVVEYGVKNYENETFFGVFQFLFTLRITKPEMIFVVFHEILSLKSQAWAAEI